MKNIIVTFLICITTQNIIFSQELSVPETLDYINSYLPSESILSISPDGTINFMGVNTYKHGRLNYEWEYDNFLKICKAHSSEISCDKQTSKCRLSKNGELVNVWNLLIRCTNKYDKCIQESTSSYIDNVECFNIIPKDYSKYATEKLLNAFGYLLSIVNESDKYKRKDNDPFAPQNFQKKTVIVANSSNTSNIKLEKQNGVFNLWATIGTIKKQFVLDTGASDISISEETERELIDAGLINKSNYLIPSLYKLADGSIIQCRRLLLPSFKIGTFTITNVKASVVGEGAPMLLGKSFLDQFKKWSIDNITQTLNLETK